MRAKRLGRGLSNLINRTETPPEGAEERPPEAARRGSGEPESPSRGAQTVPVAAVQPNPYQPRTSFDEAGLEDLQASIREHGVLQPIVVRRTPLGYEIIAGERRLRAAQALGLAAIPAVVRQATDEEMQILALVENVQREDLNAMEKARALQAMMRNFELTQEAAAERVGKARTTVANLIRLLDLPREVQAHVEAGRLTGAHARAVLQAEGEARRRALAEQAIRHGWSVREVERRARSGPTVGKRRSVSAPSDDPYLRDIEERLQRHLGAQVRLRSRGKGGRIEIRWLDSDDLDRVLQALGA